MLVLKFWSIVMLFYSLELANSLFTCVHMGCYLDTELENVDACICFNVSTKIANVAFTNDADQRCN